MLDKLKLDEIVLPNETKHQIYLDGAQPTVTETGKLLGRIPRAVNAAFASLDCWILEREHHVARTKELLTQNLENADPEKIVPPEPYVAVPAIQALSYSMNSEELRKMYANLLAKSIYTDTKDNVHPAFTEIIKNLSHLDCKLFESIMKKRIQQIPYFEIRIGKTESSSYTVLISHLTEFMFDSTQNIETSINNLERNQLIKSVDFHYNDDAMYDPIRNTPFYQVLEEQFKDRFEDKKLFSHKMSLHSTSLGLAFYNICCKPL